MCARAAQRIEQAAFASAPGPSRFESAHYSGHHNAVRLCMAGSPWYLRQDDGTEDADSTVAELCALLEQAQGLFRSTDGRRVLHGRALSKGSP